MTAVNSEDLEQKIVRLVPYYRSVANLHGFELPRFDSVVDEFFWVVDQVQALPKPSKKEYRAKHGIPPWEMEGQRIDAEWRRFVKEDPYGLFEQEEEVPM